MSQAVARFRAIELANGCGLVNDSDDSELWMGVQAIHPMESRKLPVIWTNNGYVITLSSDPDGFAWYGCVHWYGAEGLLANSVYREAAARVQKYSSDDFENFGFNPDMAIRMSKPTRATRPYGPGGGGTLDQELHAASAKTR
eukprot:3197989-Heterocapsa_arctica.AAC.1